MLDTDANTYSENLRRLEPTHEYPAAPVTPRARLSIAAEATTFTVTRFDDPAPALMYSSAWFDRPPWRVLRDAWVDLLSAVDLENPGSQFDPVF